MDFILYHDWSDRGVDNGPFLTAETITNSNLERILSGTFRDPLISDEDSEEDQHHDIEALKQECLTKLEKTQNHKQKPQKCFIPGVRPEPLYPRLSNLTVQQHHAGLRVLAERHRTNCSSINTPSPEDYQIFMDARETYAKEQKEYREWARHLWLSNHILRHLRPTPLVERVYEGDWRARVTAAASLPLHYEFAAQIPMSSENTHCELAMVRHLKKVDMSKVPEATLPTLNRYHSVIVRSRPGKLDVQPCRRHPCRTVLPDEERPSTLPMREIHAELAKYASNNEAVCVVSERALRCMVQTDTTWNLPITVKAIFSGNGMQTAVVIDSDISPQKQTKLPRTERALHLLLRHAITRFHQEEDYCQNKETEEEVDREKIKPAGSSPHADSDTSDDEDRMVIDLGDEKEEESQNLPQAATLDKPVPKKPGGKSAGSLAEVSGLSLQETPDKVEPEVRLQDSCTCQDILYQGDLRQRPLHISYKKWELRNASTNDAIPIIVHCSHKHVKDREKDVLVNVVPEYQLELGGAAVSACRLRSCALAMHLREKATLLTSRIDACNGQIVTLEYTEKGQLVEENSLVQQSTSVLYNAFSELRRLKPDHYVLHHEPQHGENALLFVTSRRGSEVQQLQTLSIALDPHEDQEREKNALQIPPVLSDTLLPVHSVRKTLPLAFSADARRRVQKSKPTAEDRRKEAIAVTKRAKRMRTRKNKKQKEEKTTTGTTD